MLIVINPKLTSPTGVPQRIITKFKSEFPHLALLVAFLMFPPSASAASCPPLTRNLSLGMSGADVSALQEFLSGDRSIYPEAQVTGYYGPLTVAAVERYQARNGIASSGSSATTGFGTVGPRTRGVIATQCAATPTSAQSVSYAQPAQAAQTAHTTQTSAAQVTQPATVYVGSVPDVHTQSTLQSLLSQITALQEQIAQMRASQTSATSVNADTHTTTASNTSLVSNTNTGTSAITTSTTASGSAGGSVTTGPNAAATQSSAPTHVDDKLVLYPTVGSLTLYATALAHQTSGCRSISYRFAWGDGSTGTTNPAQICGAGSQSLSHTYAKDASYTVSLSDLTTGAIIASQTIAMSSTTVATSTASVSTVTWTTATGNIVVAHPIPLPVIDTAVSANTGGTSTEVYVQENACHQAASQEYNNDTAAYAASYGPTVVMSQQSTWPPGLIDGVHTLETQYHTKNDACVAARNAQLAIIAQQQRVSATASAVPVGTSGALTATFAIKPNPDPAQPNTSILEMHMFTTSPGTSILFSLVVDWGTARDANARWGDTIGYATDGNILDMAPFQTVSGAAVTVYDGTSVSAVQQQIANGTAKVLARLTI